QVTPAPTCAILKRAAAGPVAEVHDRMPVILPDTAHREMMDPALEDAAKVSAIIREQALTEFEHYPVSACLNSARTDDPGMIERVD
ncbi:MAG: SOS response-associated peptidase family protein, partial [Burkholderiales bacterium]